MLGVATLGVAMTLHDDLHRSRRRKRMSRHRQPVRLLADRRCFATDPELDAATPLRPRLELRRRVISTSGRHFDLEAQASPPDSGAQPLHSGHGDQGGASVGTPDCRSVIYSARRNPASDQCPLG